MKSSDAVPEPLRPLPGHAERVPPGDLPVPRDSADVDRRRRILDAITLLVAKRGYNATTLELIVRRAHVGFPAFYKSFKSKEDAFLALFDEIATKASSLTHEAIGLNAHRPWPEQVDAVLSILFEALAAHPLHARVCLVEALTAGPVAIARYEQVLATIGVPVLSPGRNYSPHAEDLSDKLEQTLAGGVAWIAYQRLVAGEADRLPSLVGGALEFVLMPYLGKDEAAHTVERLRPGGA